MLTQNKLIELIDEYKLSAYKDQILEQSKPAIHIVREYVPNEDDLPIGTSKIGGNPDLPADFKWQYYNDLPLTFLAQIKLSDVTEQDGDKVLPTTGWLYFFYDIWSIHWGEPEQADGFLTYYVEDDNTSLNRIPHPTAQSEWMQVQALPTFKLTFSELWTPSLAEDIFASNLFNWDDDASENYIEILTTLEENYPPLHYLLGHPFQIQGDLDAEAQLNANGYPFGGTNHQEAYEKLQSGFKDWRLLFQMDSDYVEEANFDLMFGDAGRLYFMIRKQDLKARNFDKVWTIMQCS